MLIAIVIAFIDYYTGMYLIATTCIRIMTIYIVLISGKYNK